MSRNRPAMVSEWEMQATLKERGWLIKRFSKGSFYPGPYYYRRENPMQLYGLEDAYKMASEVKA